MGKNAITLIASEETFKNLSSFKDIKQLNNSIRQYKEKYAKELTRNFLKVLDQLHRYSAKYIGVSFRTKQNIADSLNISRKTVQRACNKLEQLGIIKQVELKRKSDMRQTSNAIVILPIVENVQQDTIEVIENCPPIKTTPGLKQNINNKRNQLINADFVSSKIPLGFTNYVKYFYNDPQTIEELFRVVSLQTRCLTYYSQQDKLELALNAFRQLIRNIKIGKRKIRNIFGYFWGIVNQMLDQEYFELITQCE